MFSAEFGSPTFTSAGKEQNVSRPKAGGEIHSYFAIISNGVFEKGLKAV